VIFQRDGDSIKAEELARESLRIRTLIYDVNDSYLDLSCNLLARNLSAQGKLGDETRGLYKRSLALSIRNEGPDGFYQQLAKPQSIVDAKRMHLLVANSHFVEAQRIWSKIHGPTHSDAVDAASRLNVVLRQL
jgi:hypothetical protein